MIATDESKETLTQMMTASFDSDTAYYFGDDQRGGPPGYDDGSLADRLFLRSHQVTYLIYQAKIIEYESGGMSYAYRK